MSSVSKAFAKSLILFVVLFSSFSKLYAGGETLSVLTTSVTGNDGWIYSPSSLPIQRPCSGLHFRVEYVAPAGTHFFQFDWFFNGVLVKSSAQSSYPFVDITTIGVDNNLYCKVTYAYDVGGGLTSKSSASFPITSQDLARRN